MLNDLITAIQNPSMRHAILVHFPIVLSIIIIPFALLAALPQCKKSKIFPIITTLLLAAFALSAALAIKAGHNAESHLGNIIKVISQTVTEHEDAAEYLGYFGLAAALLSLLAFTPKPKLARIGKYLTLIAAALIAAQVGKTAHLGGTMVYKYGAGTPNPMTKPQYEELNAIQSNENPESLVSDPRLLTFRKQIKPLLEDQCFGCHHPGAKKTQLDLTSFRALQTTGKNSPIIIPGDPDGSFIISVLEWTGKLKMPKGGDQLTKEQITTIKKWIKDGAVWE